MRSAAYRGGVRRSWLLVALVLASGCSSGAQLTAPPVPGASSNVQPSASDSQSPAPVQTLSPGATLAPLPAPAPARLPGCRSASKVAFSPRTISIPGLVGPAGVLPLGYDAAGVPGTPPLTSAGKRQFAWVPNIAPGMAAGNVLLNAHTFPDGSALGNDLLSGLAVGKRLVVRGDGHVLCYRVTSRTEVPADASVAEYFALDGPPRLAIVVCSGDRLGPGDWTHRTIWYAAPVQL